MGAGNELPASGRDLIVVQAWCAVETLEAKDVLGFGVVWAVGGSFLKCAL